MSSTTPGVDNKTNTNSDKKATSKDDSSTQNDDTLSAVPVGGSKFKTLEHMLYDNIDGVNYYFVTEKDRLIKQLPIVLGLNLRHDDVILCGYPKSGNNWTFEVMSMIMRQETNFSERTFFMNLLEFLNEDVQSVIDAIESPRILNIHLRSIRLPLQVVEKRLKMVYILRNPKDIVVSLYCMFSTFGPHIMRYYGTFSEFLDLYLKGDFFWGFWFDHVWSYETFMNENPEHPVFILSFEKMKQEPVKTIKDLCAFLEKPEYLAKDIARVTQFSNMKSTLLNGKMKPVQNLISQNGTEFLFRKGEIGDWKNWFTTDQNKAFNKMFDERMGGSKLADIVREYM